MLTADHAGDEPVVPPRQAGEDKPAGAETGPRIALTESTTEATIARNLKSQRRAAQSPAVLVAHVVSLVGGLAVLWFVDRRQWFFGDDWDFIVDRGLSHARFGLWTPHNEHWSTLPILLYRALFNLVGVRTYVPYILAVIVAHLILTQLIWRVLLRVGTDAWVATGLAAVFAVLGAGSENLLWAFQIGFIASVMFGYFALLLIDGEVLSLRRQVLAALALIAGLMCSGIGVTMVAVAGATILLRHGWRAWRQAGLVVIVPAAVFLTWFALAGRKGLAGDHQQLDSLLNIPAFLWTGLTAAFERTSAIPGAGAVLVVILGGWLVGRAARDPVAQASTLALAGGVVLMFLIIALGRSSHGVSEATSIRYSYLTMALVLPAIGVGLTRLVGVGVGAGAAAMAGAGRVGGRGGILVLLAFIAVSNIALLRTDSNAKIARDKPLERQIVASADLIASGRPILADQPEPIFDPNISASSLLRLRRQHDLPTVALGPDDRLAAVAQLQIALSGTALLPGRFPAPTLAAASVSDQGDCLTAQSIGPAAFVGLQTPSGGAATQITASQDSAVEVVVLSPDSRAGRKRTFHLGTGQPMYLSVAASGASLRVYLPPSGALSLCGLAR